MNEKDLRPAHEFAVTFGCKVVLYGEPGIGKTPIAATTAPRPLLLASEPGMLTLKGQSTPTYTAFSAERIDDFFTWFFSDSKEVSNYDTLIWDSASQGAEVYLDKHLGGKTKAGNEQHGLKAHGSMATDMMKHISKLYFMPKKHIILITKRAISDDMGVQRAKPYFPGNVLNIKVPHLFDAVLQLGRFPATGVQTPLLQCHSTFEAVARERTGMCAQYEHPHFGNLFAKMMS